MTSSTQLILLAASFVFPIIAQIYLSRVFAKGRKVMSHRGLTGLATAQKILQAEGLDIPVENVPGHLSDHYDPINRKLALSDSVYGEQSVAAVAVAAHEVGHAIQHKMGYKYLVLRTTLYPVVGFSSNVAPFLILGGIFFSTVPYLLHVGIVLFAISVIFTLITLPVEFDASRRALVAIDQLGLVTVDEHQVAKSVLNAAALTYVAAAVTAILELVRLILIAKGQE
jgi:Zn-dependent membrane protease YugP